MFNAKKTAQLFLAFTMIAIGAAVEFSAVYSTRSSMDEVQVASRYQLRNRTPNFFGRSRTATNAAPATRAQPVVRRG